jgi:hypothetical protein
MTSTDRATRRDCTDDDVPAQPPHDTRLTGFRRRCGVHLARSPVPASSRSPKEDLRPSRSCRSLQLGATKGSFYWHFANREALIAAALADWEQSHTVAVIAEIEAASDDPLRKLRLLFKRVTELAARDRIELALLATADDPSVRPVLDRVTRRRIEFAGELFQRLGFSRAEAGRRARLA